MKSAEVFMIGAILCLLGGIRIKECSAQGINLCASNNSQTTCYCTYDSIRYVRYLVLQADCTRMNFEKFPRDDQLPDVEDLDLSHNGIEALDSFTNSFENPKLLSLKLSFNQLSYVSPDFFKNTPNLRELDLSYNDLKNFPNSNSFRGLRRLNVLNLSFNKISTLPEDIFSFMPNLRELDLRYNYLGGLVMGSASIFHTNWGLSSDITTLKLDGLGISSLHYEYFDKAHYLRYLSLSDNPLEEIPTVPYTLDVLDLSGTDITTLSAKRLNYHSLKVLTLNRLKKLEKIEHYAFYNLQALEELYLSDTRMLKEFNDLAFGVITNETQLSLKRISLARSGLLGINSTFSHVFSKMEHVDLQGNPWVCNCNVLWLQELAGFLYREDNMRCLAPFTLLNKRIMELNETHVPGCRESSNQVQRVLISILGSLVTILVILIIYLVYLGPFTGSNKYRGIGPESPYHGNTIGIIPTRAENLG